MRKKYDAYDDMLIRKKKRDLIWRELLPLSVLGKVESVKMNLLLGLLFLFQSLPIRVPISTFYHIK